MSTVTAAPTTEVVTFTLPPRLVHIQHKEGTSLVSVSVILHLDTNTARIHAVAQSVQDSHAEYVSEPWTNGERGRGAITFTGTHDSSERFHILPPVLPSYLHRTLRP